MTMRMLASLIQRISVWKRLALVTLLALGIAISGPTSTLAAAQINLDWLSCPAGYVEICILFENKTASSITVKYGPAYGGQIYSPGHDEYHVIWSRVGSVQHQVNTGKNQHFTLNGTQRGVNYRFSVQRCEKVLIGADDCTGWTHIDIIGG